MTLNPTDYTYICSLVYEHAGIVLEAGKEYLVESRLLPLAHQEGLAALAELIAQLRAESFKDLHQQVIEAMMINEMSFFRDVHPFEALKTVILPELMEKRAGARTLHIWCAACASGQEPYSVAMELREHFPELAQWRLCIVASDISGKMLELARAGCYRQLEVNRGLPAPLLVKYFQKQGLVWQVQAELRHYMDFRQFNLAGIWPPLPDMDLVLMRNVLIYFDVETKQTILGKVRQVLKPDGYLILGGAETTRHLDDAFEWVTINQASCYRLRTS